MPRISQVKEEKIKESILAFLFQHTPRALFTYHIAQELARDEEFIKRLLQELEAKELILGVRKNSQGEEYSRRIRWRLADKTYQAYKNLNGN
jgi:RNase H-fold protein (predicted Holliday junction resolvase)